MRWRKAKRLAELEEKHKAEVQELHRQIAWLIASATDEQRRKWTVDAARHLDAAGEAEANWEETLRTLMDAHLMEVLALRGRVAGLEKDVAELRGEER